MIKMLFKYDALQRLNEYSCYPKHLNEPDEK